MVRNLEANTGDNHITLFGLRDPRQGIVHVVGPEQGLTLPGLLIVCGDSHTSTHGAFGAYAFGIGASEVAHVLMTQTLWQRKPKRMRITVDGALGTGIAAKDIALAIIARIRADGAQGHAIEFAGSAIRALSMDGRTRRNHFRLSERQTLRAEGCRFRSRGGILVYADNGCRRGLRPRGFARRKRNRADRHLGHDARRCFAG
jgi:hypothetical protein